MYLNRGSLITVLFYIKETVYYLFYLLLSRSIRVRVRTIQSQDRVTLIEKHYIDYNPVEPAESGH